jgi:hypothetical protein
MLGPDALENAINYYQMVMIHALPERRGEIRIQIARCYRELAYYREDMEFLHLSLENYDGALRTSLSSEDRQKVTNEKIYFLFTSTDRNNDSAWQKLQGLAASAFEQFPNDPWTILNYAYVLTSDLLDSPSLEFSELSKTMALIQMGQNISRSNHLPCDSFHVSHICMAALLILQNNSLEEDENFSHFLLPNFIAALNHWQSYIISNLGFAPGGRSPPR